MSETVKKYTLECDPIIQLACMETFQDNRCVCPSRVADMQIPLSKQGAYKLCETMDSFGTLTLLPSTLCHDYKEDNGKYNATNK